MEELGPGYSASSCAFLAMAHHRLDHGPDAKRHFDAAKPNEDDGWEHRLVYRVLRAEAVKVLGEKPK